MKNIRDYGAILLAAVLWGCAALTVNLLGDSGASNQEILFVRAATSTLVMAIWIGLTDKKLFRIRLRDLWIFFGQGVLGYAATNLTYFYCIRTCSMGTAAALMYLAPAVVAVLSVPVFRERLTLPKAVSASLVLLGAACTAGIFQGGGTYPVSGLLTGVLCGFVYGLYSIFGRISVGRYHVLTANFYSFGLAALFVFPMLPSRSCWEPWCWPPCCAARRPICSIPWRCAMCLPAQPPWFPPWSPPWRRCWAGRCITKVWAPKRSSASG